MKRLNKTLGLIGCGNMGSAILASLLERKKADSGKVFIHDQDRSKLRRAVSLFRVQAAKNNLDLIKRAEIILLAVKPQDLSRLSSEIRFKIRRDQMFVSILAGTKINKLKKILGNHVPLVRAMPN